MIDQRNEVCHFDKLNLVRDQLREVGGVFEEMKQQVQSLQPGTLWTLTLERTQAALQKGALLPIPTNSEFVEQDGICFLVRILANLVRKDIARQQQEQSANSGKDFNPFLPYEEDLFVTYLSESHVCILNKFNVVNHHLLIITRDFEEQESLLTLADFAALWTCMTEFDSLGFYNAGKAAGASQRHKHLQLVPLPLVPGGCSLPIAAKMTRLEFQSSITTLPELPFVQAIARLNLEPTTPPAEAAALLLNQYRALLATLGLEQPTTSVCKTGPYNLLVTRQWMLMIPRTRDSFQSISVNALGFAGTLFVRDQQQLQILKQHGPMTVLSRTAIATSTA